MKAFFSVLIHCLIPAILTAQPLKQSSRSTESTPISSSPSTINLFQDSTYITLNHLDDVFNLKKNDLIISIDGRYKSLSQIEQVLDSFLRTLDSTPPFTNIPGSAQIDKIVDTLVRRLQNNSKNGQHVIAAQIIEAATKELANPADRILAILLLSSKILRNSVYERYNYNQFDALAFRVIDDLHNAKTEAECWEVVGQFYDGISVIKSFYGYTRSYNICQKLNLSHRQADIELQIANMLSYRVHPTFVDKSISYYNRASNHYLHSGDTLSMYHTEMLKFRVLQMEKRPDLIDLADFLATARRTYEFYLKTGVQNNYRWYLLFVNLGYYYSVTINETVHYNVGYSINYWNLLIGRKYYCAALFSLLNEGVQPNLSEFSFAIWRLAYVEAAINNTAKNRYVDLSFQIARNKNSKFAELNNYLQNARIEKIHGSYSDAQEIFWKGYYSPWIDSLSEMERTEVLRFGNTIGTDIYWDTNTDSLAKYKVSGESIQSSYLYELDEITQMEIEIAETYHHSIIDSLHIKIQQENRKLVAISSHLFDAALKLKLVQAAFDTTTEQNKQAEKKNKKLSLETKRLDESVKRKKTEIAMLQISDRQKSDLLIITLLTIVLISAVTAAVVKISQSRLKAKDQRLEFTRTQLSDLARAKIHNIRSNYNRIKVLAAEDNVLLFSYLEKSARHLKLLLNTWNNKHWTLHDELELLKSFYYAEDVLKRGVIIEVEKNDLIADQVMFMPEVFTTLYFNSIFHGFRNKETNCLVSIKIQRHEDNLVVSVSDNGEGNEISCYLSNDPGHGLNILKDRIKNAFEMKGNFESLDNTLTITASKQTGTTISFIYPYAETVNTHR